ncbi:MAG TPA: sigma-70 family RNA polymerase sigma factor [Verrucomicrobiae bacterium]|nr:sigma-70 family RNA polymerase sigma factor [Verrucomicrobiae bacterium]
MKTPFAELTDEQVVAASLERREAFGVLVSRYQDRLTRYLRRLGVSRGEDIEDVLQDVFLKAYRNLNDFDQSLRFSSWIYRIAHNTAMSFFRAKRVRPEGMLVDDSEEALSHVKSDLNIETEAERNFDAERLRTALDTLDPKYRDVLVLRYFEQRDYAEISDILRIPEGTVATLIHRAKKRLHDALTATHKPV